MAADLLKRYTEELIRLEGKSNLRSLPELVHQGRYVNRQKESMLNLSSNDYLGLASDMKLRENFLESLTPETFQPSASSSRLLTGNFSANKKLEDTLCRLFAAESSLVFNSGYHMNIGILPAVSDGNTLILADKLVHASLIDGIRLSTAKFYRYRHNDYAQLELLLHKNHSKYEQIIIVTESIFSMDGDEADLRRLAAMKKSYPNVMLYVDEAHAVGVKGASGLGCAQEQDCIGDIDFLAGTFGKALASVGGYIVCKKVIRDYLINKMRPLIFTTGLPPVNLMWSCFIMERLGDFSVRRKQLEMLGQSLKKALYAKGYSCPSTSHIIPIMIGDSRQTVLKTQKLQDEGFYMVPVRPPTVPEGTSRIRVSLTSSIREEEIERLITLL